MNCSACKTANREGRKFCSGCGARLVLICAACATPNEVGEGFCGECGTTLQSTARLPSAERAPASYTPKHLADRILQSRSALEGERKQVTVLFADVKGSMELAEQLDPEEWHQILERFFAILTEGIHRFEGTVNQYTGDGIMALFGAPIAHEDHAQRACYAALHMQGALHEFSSEIRRTRGLRFSTRIGLNSGEVVVGRIGDDLRMDYTAQGHTVGLAQRIEQLAEPGAACLTAHTARLVEGYFLLSALGDFPLKGVSEPVAVFALEGAGAVNSRIELAQTRGFTKFVGRNDELATLDAALERSLAGHGQTVGVVAEAGTGKSRLCYEFLQRCRTRGFTVIEARGVAHGRNVPLLPMLALFRAYFGVRDGDGAVTSRNKIAARLLALDESLRAELPLFFNLLGVPDPDQPLPAGDADTLQRRTYAAVRALVRADGMREKPAILFFEDLHWLDPASDAYLAQIIEANAGTRGLALVNLRPEYRAPWMLTPAYQQLPLVPLGVAAVGELLDDLLGADPSVAGLAEIVHRRAAGNPFFIEEIVQNLIETSALVGKRGAYRLTRMADALMLPASVQAQLAARIDRLPQREKHLLQQAAVIGRTFQERILLRICGLDAEAMHESLQALRAAEFLHEESLYPHLAYAFKHPLTHEVAGRSQLQERRAATHAAVARVIEALSAERLDEAAAQLALHWHEAGETMTAARWHARAARWIGVGNYVEADVHWRQVVALIPETEDSRELIALRVEALRTIITLAFRVRADAEDTARLFAAARRDLSRLGDDAELALLTAAYGAVRKTLGDIDGYLALTTEASALAARSGNPGARAVVGIEHLTALYAKGRLSEALATALFVRELCAGDIHLGEALVGYSPYIISYGISAAPLIELGRLREAEAGAQVGLELAMEHGPDESRGFAQLFFVMVIDARGEPDPRAIDAARLAAEAALRSGSAWARGASFYTLTLAHALNGEWQAALVAADDGCRLCREQRIFGDFSALLIAAYARALLATGAVTRAVEVAAEAADVARGQHQPAHLCAALLTYARCLRACEGPAAVTTIEGLLTETLQLIDETGAERWRGHVHEERSELYRLLADDESARRERIEAQRLFTDIGADGHARRLEQELLR